MSTPSSRPRPPRPSRSLPRPPAASSSEGAATAAPERSLGSVLDFMRTLWAVDHSLFAATQPQRQKLGITGPQRLVLRIVASYPGISPGDLSTLLHLHPSTVTGLVKRLARKRLLVRGTHSQDARRAVLTLTAQGMALGLEPGPAEELVQDALDVLDPSDVAIAETVLRTVARALTARRPKLRVRAVRRARAPGPGPSR